MNDKLTKITAAAGKYRYLLIVLAAGLILMLLPGRQSSVSAAGVKAADKEARVEYVLSGSEGAGETMVLLSDSGAVVVCQGAGDPRVRLDIVSAVCSYTGLTSDRVTILQLQETKNGEASA